MGARPCVKRCIRAALSDAHVRRQMARSETIDRKLELNTEAFVALLLISATVAVVVRRADGGNHRTPPSPVHVEKARSDPVGGPSCSWSDLGWSAPVTTLRWSRAEMCHLRRLGTSGPG